MAGPSRDHPMSGITELQQANPGTNRRQRDKEAADNIKSKLVHQWFDPKRYPDPLSRDTAQSSIPVPGVTPEMEQKWHDIIAKGKKRDYP